MMDKISLIPWLLEASTATIRYQTLTHLLNFPENDPQVLLAKNEIDSSGAVPAILSMQTTPGRWPYVNHYYTPKYTSTHWSLMLLEELHINPLENLFQLGVEYMLEEANKDIRKHHALDNTSWTCLWGNIIRYAVYAGRFNDERFQEMLNLTAISLFKSNCNCLYNQNYACSWGVARTLWGLAAIPENDRSLLVKNAIKQGVDFMLQKYNLVSADYLAPDEGKVHPLWSKISFPLFYQADILMVLRILAQLHQLDQPAVRPALDWLQNRRRADGRWRGSSPFRKRTWPEMGDPEETNRWVSLQACQVLLQAGRINSL
jgi:hypothetical protein